jgi:hypothetical protein
VARGETNKPFMSILLLRAEQPRPGRSISDQHPLRLPSPNPDAAVLFLTPSHHRSPEDEGELREKCRRFSFFICRSFIHSRGIKLQKGSEIKIKITWFLASYKRNPTEVSNTRYSPYPPTPLPSSKQWPPIPPPR